MKTLPASALAIAAMLACAAALAQHGQGTHRHAAGADPAPANGPYADMQRRDIKALSDQQIADLRSGKGMSLALPAELNGYPGPSHALELADQLGLTPQQRATTRTLLAQMQREAKAAGENLIAAESTLDRLFKEKQATTESVGAATARAAQAQGQLRETHLRYHLAMIEVLSADQVADYNRLRGYSR